MAIKKIILKLWRQQYGFDRTSVVISAGAIAKATGISPRYFWDVISIMKSDTNSDGTPKIPLIEDVKKADRARGIASITETSELRINFHDSSIQNNSIGINPTIFGIPHWFFDGVGGMEAPLRSWNAIDIDLFIYICAMYYQYFEGEIRVNDMRTKQIKLRDYTLSQTPFSKTTSKTIRNAVRKMDSLGIIVISGGGRTGSPLSFRLPLKHEMDECSSKWISITGCKNISATNGESEIAEAGAQIAEAGAQNAEAGAQNAVTRQIAQSQKQGLRTQKQGYGSHNIGSEIAEAGAQIADNEVVVVKEIDTTTTGTVFSVPENFSLIFEGKRIDTSVMEIIDWFIERSVIKKTKGDLKADLRRKASHGIGVWVDAKATGAFNIGPYVDWLSEIRIEKEEEKIIRDIKKILGDGMFAEIKRINGEKGYFIADAQNNNFTVIDSLSEKEEGVTTATARIASSIYARKDKIEAHAKPPIEVDSFIHKFSKALAAGGNITIEAPGQPEKNIVIVKIKEMEQVVIVRSNGNESELHIGQVRIYLEMLGYSLNINDGNLKESNV